MSKTLNDINELLLEHERANPLRFYVSREIIALREFVARKVKGPHGLGIVLNENDREELFTILKSRIDRKPEYSEPPKPGDILFFNLNDLLINDSFDSESSYKSLTDEKPNNLKHKFEIIKIIAKTSTNAHEVLFQQKKDLSIKKVSRKWAFKKLEDVNEIILDCFAGEIYRFLEKLNQNLVFILTKKILKNFMSLLN